MPLGEIGRDVVKENVAERREPEEGELNEERTPELDDLGTLLVEQPDPESVRTHLCTGSASLWSMIWWRRSAQESMPFDIEPCLCTFASSRGTQEDHLLTASGEIPQPRIISPSDLPAFLQVLGLQYRQEKDQRYSVLEKEPVAAENLNDPTQGTSYIVSPGTNGNLTFRYLSSSTPCLMHPSFFYVAESSLYQLFGAYSRRPH